MNRSKAEWTPADVKLHLERAIAFLEEIDIESTRCHGTSGFLQKVRIVEGGLHVDPGAKVEDVLHEAGHLCILPPRYRRVANDDLTGVEAAISADVDKDCFEIDSLMMRAIVQAGDCEATAWAWAAGLHLGVPLELIVSDQAYGGDGASIRTQLRLNAYLGINGLQHAGMCSIRGAVAYPKMIKWTQTAGVSAEDSFCSYSRLGHG